MYGKRRTLLSSRRGGEPGCRWCRRRRGRWRSGRAHQAIDAHVAAEGDSCRSKPLRRRRRIPASCCWNWRELEAAEAEALCGRSHCASPLKALDHGGARDIGRPCRVMLRKGLAGDHRLRRERGIQPHVAGDGLSLSSEKRLLSPRGCRRRSRRELALQAAQMHVAADGIGLRDPGRSTQVMSPLRSVPPLPAIARRCRRRR